MKVYIVQFEWNVDGATEFEIIGVYKDKENAVAKLKEEREKVINDYTYGYDYEIETDSEECFQYQQNEWDKYYILNIEEKEVK